MRETLYSEGLHSSFWMLERKLTTSLKVRAANASKVVNIISSSGRTHRNSPHLLELVCSEDEKNEVTWKGCESLAGREIEALMCPLWSLCLTPSDSAKAKAGKSKHSDSGETNPKLLRGSGLERKLSQFNTYSAGTVSVMLSLASLSPWAQGQWETSSQKSRGRERLRHLPSSGIHPHRCSHL